MHKGAEPDDILSLATTEQPVVISLTLSQRDSDKRMERSIDKRHKVDDVGIVASLFESCMKLLKLSIVNVRDTDIKKTTMKSLEDSMATLFCWGDELGVPRGDLDEVLRYSEETRDLTLAVLISLGEFLSHDLASIFSQSDRKEMLQKSRINEQMDKAKSMTMDWEDPVSEDQGDVENLSVALKMEVARLNILGQILDDPVPTFVDVEEVRAIGLAEDRPAHQYYADMISARFPKAKSSLTELMGKCNWVRYNRIQRQREGNACGEQTLVDDGGSKSRFQDSGLGTSVPAQSVCVNEYAETVFSKRAETSHKRLPPLPEEGRKGKPFLCDICNTTVTIYRSAAWKKHVFADIFTYVCIFENCPSDRDFFKDQDAMTMHLGLQHGFEGNWQSQVCPLCLEQTGSGRNTVSLHFSRHMEEIALRALPSMAELEEESETSSLREQSNDLMSANPTDATTSPLLHPWIDQDQLHVESHGDQGVGEGCPIDEEIPTGLWDLPEPVIYKTEAKQSKESLPPDVNGSGNAPSSPDNSLSDKISLSGDSKDPSTAPSAPAPSEGTNYKFPEPIVNNAEQASVLGPMQSFYPDPDELLSAICELCGVSVEYCAHALTNHTQRAFTFTEATFLDHPEWPHTVTGLDVLPDPVMPQLPTPYMDFERQLALLSSEVVHQLDQSATTVQPSTIMEHIESRYTPGDRLRRPSNRRQAPRIGGFPCAYDTCQKTFNRACDRKRHEKTHLERSERPHKCNECDVSFLYPKDLIRHQRTHDQSSAPSLECPVAGCDNAGFSRRDNLRRHMRNQHGLPLMS